MWETRSSEPSGLVVRRCGRAANSHACVSGKQTRGSSSRTWTTHVSPTARADHSPSILESPPALNSTPRSVANAPRETFYSAYHGSRFRATCADHRVRERCSSPSETGSFISARPYARTSNFAHKPENDDSVAPSETASRYDDPTNSSSSRGQ